jgi:RNA polymerase primary sigma factor
VTREPAENLPLTDEDDEIDLTPGPVTEPKSVDLTKLYLREIGRIPLLTREGEIALARRIRRGDQAAKDEMVEANLRLVVSVAKRYVNQGGFSLLDLVQEGNIGLMRAVETFDHRKGFRFSTYATHWIKQTIYRALALKGRTVRLPVNVADSALSVARTSRALAQELGREPTDQEVSQETQQPAHKIRRLRKVSRDVLSLDQTVGEDKETAFSDFVENPADSPLDRVASLSMREELDGWLDDLPAREALILRLRFGLDGGPPQTLEEIGQHLGITRERARQIEKAALNRLRKR